MSMGGSKEQLCELCTQQSDKDMCISACACVFHDN